MNNKSEIVDITVIGGGPTGIFTAFYAGLRQASVKVIESLPELGGQLTALYPEKFIYDIAGFPKISGQQLVDNLIEQMSQFGPIICTGQEVLHIEKLNDQTFKVTTNQEIHYSKTIIITAGNGAFQPRKLNVAEAEKFEQTNLYYSVINMNQFENKEIAIFGGGDSAVDWALMLEKIAKKVTLIHRRDRFRAHEHSVALLKDSTVNILTPYIPTELIGEKQIEKVNIKHVKRKEIYPLNVDAVLVNYGFASSLGPINHWGLHIDNGSIRVNSSMETNIEGIYAVGDINTYEGKVKLIATGFGEAPIAVSKAKVYIDPKTRLQPQYSTNVMGEKGEKSKRIVNVNV